MKKYKEYKQTQYPWMGEIPSHWHDINPKALFNQRKDRAQEGERQLTASQQYGILFQGVSHRGKARIQTAYIHEYAGKDKGSLSGSKGRDTKGSKKTTTATAATD